MAIVKSTVCACRNAFNYDAGWHGALAGLLTSASLVFEEGRRVQELMLYCVPKGLEVAWLWAREKRLVRSVPYGDALLFSAACAIIGSTEPNDFKPTYSRLLRFLFGDH